MALTSLLRSEGEGPEESPTDADVKRDSTHDEKGSTPAIHPNQNLAERGEREGSNPCATHRQPCGQCPAFVKVVGHSQDRGDIAHREAGTHNHAKGDVQLPDGGHEGTGHKAQARQQPCHYSDGPAAKPGGEATGHRSQ